MAAMTTVTVQTNKELHLSKGGRAIVKKVATEQASIPTHEAVKLKAAGIVTY
jgi:hypothetical protein